MKKIIPILLLFNLFSCSKSGMHSAPQASLNGVYTGTFQSLVPFYIYIAPRPVDLTIENGKWTAVPNDTLTVNGTVYVGINHGSYSLFADSARFKNEIDLPIVPNMPGYTTVLNTTYVVKRTKDSLYLFTLNENGYGESYSLKMK